MKRCYAVIVLVAMGSVVLACAPRRENTESMIAAAKALDQQFLAAANKGDVDGIMACYWKSPEMILYPPDALEARGWDAAKEGFKAFLANGPGVKFEMLESHYAAGGAIVAAWGKVKVTMPGPEGAPVDMVIRFTEVIGQRDGKWVYLVDHASAALPPAPAPAAK